MKNICLALLLFLNFTIFAQEETATLIFHDDFNREEPDNSKEDLGKAWITNSKHRAHGVKQADLKHNALHITMAKNANHGVSVRQNAPFKNGIVEAKFMITDKKGISFNFNDPAIKNISWAGHVCQVKITPNSIKINDQKEGLFKLSTHKKKKAGATLEALETLTKGTVKTIHKETALNTWHTIKMKFQNDTLTVWIDSKNIGSHTSPGFGNNPKQNLAIAVTSYVVIDDVKIYRLN